MTSHAEGTRHKRRGPVSSLNLLVAGLAIAAAAVSLYFLAFSNIAMVVYDRVAEAEILNPTPPPPTLDKADYDTRMLALAHIDPSATTLSNPPGSLATTTASGTPLLIVSSTASTSVSAAGKLWPKAASYPEVGALLPFHRIIAYYGNFYSKGMGVLGEYPEDTMLAMLASTTARWDAADPSMPTIPAIDYIAVTAQGSKGWDGKYRARMPDDQIEKAIGIADKIHGIVILDVQVGLSDLETELPLLEPYLKLPQVHLAVDPEFSMKDGVPPGHEIGTMNSADINYAAQYLAELVRTNNLPPKILVVHRFTEEMVTGYKQIKPLPEVQIVMDMDGWGFPAKKINTYNAVVVPEPIQFTGFKLFYKNDLKPPSTALLTPAQVLSLTPAPVFIQYQ